MATSGAGAAGATATGAAAGAATAAGASTWWTGRLVAATRNPRASEMYWTDCTIPFAST